MLPKVMAVQGTGLGAQKLWGPRRICQAGGWGRKWDSGRGGALVCCKGRGLRGVEELNKTGHTLNRKKKKKKDNLG